jgi:hypothetical protein
MLEENLNLVGYSAIVSSVVSRLSKEHHICGFRDCLM